MGFFGDCFYKKQCIYNKNKIMLITRNWCFLKYGIPKILNIVCSFEPRLRTCLTKNILEVGLESLFLMRG